MTLKGFKSRKEYMYRSEDHECYGSDLEEIQGLLRAVKHF